MKIPFHIILRRKIRAIIDFLLHFFSPTITSTPIEKKEIKNILLIRINYRIGNMLFITPLLDNLQKEFPNAKIDILLGASYTKSLFSGFKNVENIYDFPRKLLKHPLLTYKFIQKIRSQQYDAVVNINYASSSDKLATFLTNAKYKIGFCKEKSFMPLNKCIRQKDKITHEALKPLELLKIFTIKPNYNQFLKIYFTNNEIYEAQQELQKILSSKDSKMIAIFRDARFEKKFNNQFWQELISNLQQKDNITFIDILSPDVPTKLTSTILSYSQKDLKKLAAFLSLLDGFICADTGPMHLASASGVSTIALFKTTTPKLYGTLKPNDLSIVTQEKTISQISDIILQQLQRNYK